MALERPLSITQLVRRMRHVLEVQIGEVWVEGEVSNLRKQRSGHWYFSLKDEGGQITAVMWAAARNSSSKALQEGSKVRAHGEVSLYEPRGQAQLIVREVEACGEGELQARFEALKRKLQAEGLFEHTRKKHLPRFPSKLALVTSQSGAALQDMLNVLSRRAPWLEVFLYPVQVQGRGTEDGIATAIRQLGQATQHGLPSCDLLIVGRGGGSLEDLWNFNEEVVARAIADCPIPVVSAVGHEIDFTIADFVADVRAPTPSAAAELAVPDAADLRTTLQQAARRITRLLQGELQARNALLGQIGRRVAAYAPERWLQAKEQGLDELAERLERAARLNLEWRQSALQEYDGRWRRLEPVKDLELLAERLAAKAGRAQVATKTCLERREAALGHFASLLSSLGPEAVLNRGFSITRDANGRVVRNADALQPGELLHTRLAAGNVLSTVTAKDANLRK